MMRFHLNNIVLNSCCSSATIKYLFFEDSELKINIYTNSVLKCINSTRKFVLLNNHNLMCITTLNRIWSVGMNSKLGL